MSIAPIRPQTPGAVWQQTANRSGDSVSSCSRPIATKCRAHDVRSISVRSTIHGPQSSSQEEQSSSPSQTWSPQTGGQAPQSPGQEAQSSSPLHSPSPHLGGQAPQSPGQEAQVSAPLQARSPHL